MKKHLTLLATLTLCSSVFATNTGPYLGLGGGVGTLRTPDQRIYATNGTNTLARGGLSGRAFVGMNYMSYFGVEMGFARYARSYYHGITNPAVSSLTYNANAIDLVAKGYLPIGHTGFNLYGLAGAARVNLATKYTNTGVALNGQVATPNPGNTHTYASRPIYGAGVNYVFGQHLIANAEYTQIRHVNAFQKTAYAIPDMSLLTANLAYAFG